MLNLRYLCLKTARLFIHCVLAVILLSPAALGQADSQQGPSDQKQQFLRGVQARAAKRCDEALTWLHKSADQGYPQAMVHLGSMYAFGECVPRDPAESFYWYRKAAELGFAPAQSTVGQRYEQGIGVRQDKDEAIGWYRKAAAQGYQDAIKNLTRLGVPVSQSAPAPAAGPTDAEVEFQLGKQAYAAKNYSDAFAWYQKAANQGHAMAENNLGTMYCNGQGVARDSVEGLRWIRKSADQGYALAYTNIGYSYLHGEGVPRDEAEAIKWYKRAATLGDSDAKAALRRLGVPLTEPAPESSNAAPIEAEALLQRGKEASSAKNYLEALKWFRQSADLGNAIAQNNLGVMYNDGMGVSVDHVQGLFWVRKAADQGYVLAEYNLALAYERGTWLQKDTAEAINWYRKAAAQGDKDAIAALARLQPPSGNQPQPPPHAVSVGPLRWSRNFPVDAPSEGRIQAETALATDTSGRIWLSFLEAAYSKTHVGTWIAFPRTVRLLVSTDAGQTFSNRADLTDRGGDESLASDARGTMYASFIQYFYESENGLQVLRERISVMQFDSDFVNSDCLPWDSGAKHDQSSLHIGREGTLYVIGRDISSEPQNQKKLLFARSLDGGKTCVDQHRLDDVGELPQAVETTKGLMLIGPGGYLVSGDGGGTFGSRVSRRFGRSLVRVAVSPDRQFVYVVSDAVGSGLLMQISPDGGRTWRSSRVDDGSSASEWRYPAVCVDSRGRVHVAWVDNRQGSASVWHSYSDDQGRTFATNSRVSDATFEFPPELPYPPPATQDGTWVGDYLAITTARDKVIVAWGDLRAGRYKPVVYVAVGQ